MGKVSNSALENGFCAARAGAPLRAKASSAGHLRQHIRLVRHLSNGPAAQEDRDIPQDGSAL